MGGRTYNEVIFGSLIFWSLSLVISLKSLRLDLEAFGGSVKLAGADRKSFNASDDIKDIKENKKDKNWKRHICNMAMSNFKRNKDTCLAELVVVTFPYFLSNMYNELIFEIFVPHILHRSSESNQ